MNFKKTVAIAAAAGALTALAIPAMAETSLYGSARISTFYNFTDIADKKTKGFDEHLQGNSRFGAKFSDGALGGVVEYGTGVNLRLLYGTYKFDSGTLTVGQDYNNYYTISNQVFADDNVNNGYGSLWDGRQAQIKFKMNNGLYVAAIIPDKNVASNPAGTGANYETANGGDKNFMPKLNVGFMGASGPVSFNVGVVGHSFKSKAADEQVVALLGYGTVKAAFGNSAIQAVLSASQNAGNMSFSLRKSYDAANKEDAIGYEGYLQFTQKISDMVGMNVGLGMSGDKYDISGSDKMDSKMLFFVNAPITIAKNVSITPEISYYNQMDDAKGDDEKKSTFAAGAKWQINF